MGWRSRQDLEREEEFRLHPAAVGSSQSLGREHQEPPHPYRMDFQRDRARIVHSAAFRRLDGKTQVFLNGTGDHFRTRLTHTIEVASVARTVARALGLNEDLTEAIALAHDLGHPPFGHAGEAELDRLMKGEGGFDHNEQSLRVVELLEERYPGVNGLNLSYEVLEGIRKHDRSHRLPDGTRCFRPSLEAQLADLADEIAYSTHDIEDGIEAGLLHLKNLERVALWNDAVEFSKAGTKNFRAKTHTAFVLRGIMNLLVDDLVLTTSQMIQSARVQSVQDVRKRKKALVAFSPTVREKLIALKKFLYQEFYFHSAVEGVHKQRCKILRNAFQLLMKKPSLLGTKALSRMEQEGLPRTVCDYLAGMTDRYLIKEFSALSAGSRPK